ncbi:MAG: hypothetical protein A3J29_06155 [Acidobacteria bacterium RIFCSPLOWO2_12_FULL_67_14b]|nr:MAG: hypothetical protein A3J29_06155 [Acidobacteria bacterium RIFCSPLOWO2_12_FULL_67_14b]
MATTTKTATGPVLTAIYNALNVAAITTTLGCGVYETVIPQNVALPYLRISTPSGLPWDTFGAAGKERVVQVHVFASTAAYESGYQVNAICDKVVELLQDQALSVTGHSLAGLRYEQDTEGADEDVDGVQIVHRVVSFRVHVIEA